MTIIKNATKTRAGFGIENESMQFTAQSKNKIILA